MRFKAVCSRGSSFELTVLLLLAFSMRPFFSFALVVGPALEQDRESLEGRSLAVTNGFAIREGEGY